MLKVDGDDGRWTTDDRRQMTEDGVQTTGHGAYI